MEKEGIVARKLIDSRPPRVEYGPLYSFPFRTQFLAGLGGRREYKPREQVHAALVVQWVGGQPLPANYSLNAVLMPPEPFAKVGVVEEE